MYKTGIVLFIFGLKRDHKIVVGLNHVKNLLHYSFISNLLHESHYLLIVFILTDNEKSMCIYILFVH